MKPCGSTDSHVAVTLVSHVCVVDASLAREVVFRGLQVTIIRVFQFYLAAKQ